MSGGVRGRLYGPELPGPGVNVVVQWQGADLTLSSPPQRVAAASLRVEPSGFNRSQLRLSWTDERGESVLVVDDPSAKLGLIAGAPEELRSSLSAAGLASNRLQRRFRGWLWLFGFVGLLLVAGVVLALGSLSRMSTALAELVPIEQELRLGELVLTQTRAQMTLTDRGLAVDALQRMGARLAAGSRYRYRWHVAKSPELNAFAAPGGIVVVTTGLFEAATQPEELAGVLAHEIAHAELRHSLHALFKSMGLRAILGVVFGGGNLTGIATQLSELRFSRDAEREADREGLRRLREAGIPADGMLHMFEKLANHARDRAVTPPAILSTHPDIEERISWLRDALQNLPTQPTQPIELDWKSIKQDLP